MITVTAAIDTLVRVFSAYGRTRVRSEKEKDTMSNTEEKTAKQKAIDAAYDAWSACNKSELAWILKYDPSFFGPPDDGSHGGGAERHAPMKPDCSKLWEAYRRLFDEDFAEAIKRAEERESTATKFEGHDNPWEDFKKMLQSENTDYLRKLPAVVLHNMPQNYQRVKNIVNEELKRRGEDPVP